MPNVALGFEPGLASSLSEKSVDYSATKEMWKNGRKKQETLYTSKKELQNLKTADGKRRCTTSLSPWVSWLQTTRIRTSESFTLLRKTGKNNVQMKHEDWKSWKCLPFETLRTERSLRWHGGTAGSSLTLCWPLGCVLPQSDKIQNGEETAQTDGNELKQNWVLKIKSY